MNVADRWRERRSGDEGRAPVPRDRSETGTLTSSELVTMYERMSVIRVFEEKVGRLYRDGEIPGFVHLSIGQEATAVGACWPLRPSDVITSTHRGHGHCLAKGLDTLAMMAELMGKENGTNRGRGGSMHIADPSLGIFGANGIVAAGLPIAVGAALAFCLRHEDGVVVAFFGDGAVAQGAFHESVNLASVWRLPVVFFCENNGYAEFTAAVDQHPVTLAERCVAYGVDHHQVDGDDVVAVAALMSEVTSRTRAGGGPVVVEGVTHRWSGHYEGDAQRYRPDDEVTHHRNHDDPLVHHRNLLLGQGATSEVIDRVDQATIAKLDRDIESARNSALPDRLSLGDFVYRSNPHPVPDPSEWTGETFRVMDAIHDALASLLEMDESVFVAGIDVGPGGNVFGVTRGLFDRWPTRVLDTPISETAIVGVGVGAAMAGMRPVVEIMYLDFIGVCFDQIMNQAAKLPYMTGGKARMSLTIRTQFGPGRSSGSQHSQSLESLLAHIPGLKVVMPSTPADYYGLLRSSVLDPNPVVFIENRLLYGMKGPKPPADHLVPIGSANVVRTGSDVTVIAWSKVVHDALAVANDLSGQGIQAEVIDLRSISPIDWEAVRSSATKTGRVLIVSESVTTHGVGAEIAADLASSTFWSLDAPIQRLGGPFTPVPYSPPLEEAWLPSRGDIEAAIRSLARV
jgi:2-oxoisovalerate dehydrogenase E1 component